MEILWRAYGIDYTPDIREYIQNNRSSPLTPAEYEQRMVFLTDCYQEMATLANRPQALVYPASGSDISPLMMADILIMLDQACYEREGNIVLTNPYRREPPLIKNLLLDIRTCKDTERWLGHAFTQGLIEFRKKYICNGMVSPTMWPMVGYFYVLGADVSELEISPYNGGLYLTGELQGKQKHVYYRQAELPEAGRKHFDPNHGKEGLEIAESFIAGVLDRHRLGVGVGVFTKADIWCTTNSLLAASKFDVIVADEVTDFAPETMERYEFTRIVGPSGDDLKPWRVSQGRFYGELDTMAVGTPKR